MVAQGTGTGTGVQVALDAQAGSGTLRYTAQPGITYRPIVVSRLQPYPIVCAWPSVRLWRKRWWVPSWLFRRLPVSRMIGRLVA
jgi:hypothetical protein